MKKVMTYEAEIKKVTAKRNKSGDLNLKIKFVTKGSKKKKEFIWNYNDSCWKWKLELIKVKEYIKAEALEDFLDKRVKIITKKGQLRAIGSIKEDKFIMINGEEIQSAPLTEAEVRKKL